MTREILFPRFRASERARLCGRQPAGFTLIELLVVIAIISVLIALCCRPCSQHGKRPDGPSAATT